MSRIKKVQVQSVKGMKDILPDDQAYWDYIIKKGRSILEDYGFNRIDTPILEQTSLFTRALGEFTATVEKEMYTFRTKGRDQLSMRPEPTSGIVRAYIEHGMHTWPNPVQLWTFGPMFRHDNPQAGRQRQFHQLDAELFGDDSSAADAQLIFIGYKIYESIGLKNILIKVNSIGDSNCRPAYIKALKHHFRGRDKKLCGQCLKRLKTNPLRLLDCKVEGCIEQGKDIPQFVDYLDDDCKGHFQGVLEFLDELNVPYLLDHTLVRGLDYYTRTAFEYVIEKTSGAEIEEKAIERISLGGGGRYDKLVEYMGGQKTPATGWGLGIERMILAMKTQGVLPPKSKIQPKVFIAQLGELGKRKALLLFEEFRKAGIMAKASFGRDGIKSQLRLSNKFEIPYTIIIGQKEALEGSVIIREMNTGSQESIPVEKVVEIIKSKVKK